MKRLFRQFGCLVLLLSATGACASIVSPQHSRAAPQAAPTEYRAASVAHIQTHALRSDQIAPRSATRTHFYEDYDRPLHRTRRAVSGCDLNVFANSSGAALVAAVRASALAGCLYDLFDIRGSAAALTFAESKMVSITQALAADALVYDGSNALGTLQLVMFLRAGYYVEYVDPGHVGSFGSALGNATNGALDSFFANSHIADVNDGHGQILGEVIILVDSTEQNARQFSAMLGMLNRYGPSHHPHYYMRGAVNSVFSVLFNGHWNADFQAVVQGNAVLLSDTLVKFIMNNRGADVGSAREFLIVNAAGELGRLLQYPPVRSMLRPKVKGILDLYGLIGAGAAVHVRLAGVVLYYDDGQCAYYGLCTFLADLELAVLPPAHARDCSATVRIRSQALTSAQLDEVCTIVGGQDDYFHDIAQTGAVPVADDYNARLDMVIFHSSTDYENYSGEIFGNYTNNGGVYLEGNPADPDNQARFLAFEAEWLRPDFQVWNLTHEYIHYLDGRFNWHGGFGVLPMTAPYSVIWYIEGFAEYVSYGYRQLLNAEALEEAANPDHFTMAQLFDTVYSGDYTRTYQWGYLATRFMFERQRTQITALYGVARIGDYLHGYPAWLDPQRHTHNIEFRNWLICFSQNQGNTSSCAGQVPDAVFASGFE